MTGWKILWDGIAICRQKWSAKLIQVDKVSPWTIKVSGAIFAPVNLRLGNRVQEDGWQDKHWAAPETEGHFVHVAEENKSHDDAIHRLQVGDERYTEGRKLAHYGYPGNVSQGGTHGAKQYQVPNICRL